MDRSVMSCETSKSQLLMWKIEAQREIRRWTHRRHYPCPGVLAR